MAIIWDDEIKTQQINPVNIKWDDEVQKQLQPKYQTIPETMAKTALIGTPLLYPFLPQREKEFLGKEAYTPALHFGSALMADIPETIIRKYFPQAILPEQQTLLGKVARGGGEIAGFGMGLPAKAGIGATRLATKFIPKLAGTKLLPRIARGVIGGGIGYATITPSGKELLALKKRIGQFGLGALFGGLTEAMVPPIVRGFRKARAPAKLKPTQRINLLQAKAKQTYGEPIQEARLIQQKLNWDKQDVRQIINENIRQSNFAMKQSILQIDDQITKSAEKGSLSFQEKLPEFFKANSRTYGNRLDEISEALINSKRGMITKGEINDIINATLGDSAEAGIQGGNPFQYLYNLGQKYMVDIKDPLDRNIEVPFKIALKEIRSIWQTISQQAKYGKFTQDDIVAAMLQKNWGQWISKYAPELQELNTAYRPVIQAMKESARIFKPAQGELATKTAENFLIRLGKQKLSGGEKRLLGMIEQGTEFAPGVGEISQGIEQLGAKRVGLIAKQELNRASLQQNLSNKLVKFQTQERELAQTINQNRQLLQNRLGQLGTRKEEVMKLMANRDKGRALRKALLYGGLALGATIIPYSIQRLLYRIRTNE